MKTFGGFEGNAQVLRILCRIEKKHIAIDAPGSAARDGVAADGVDYRAGLNLTSRSLASVLKYDATIPIVRDPDSSVVKGTYHSEQDFVTQIKQLTLGHSPPEGSFKTIECGIMDIADDIAYSTYDLEDTFKAGFLTPLGSLTLEPNVIEAVLAAASKALKTELNEADLREVLQKVFASIATVDGDTDCLEGVLLAHSASNELASSGYARLALTCQLVGESVEAVELEMNEQAPQLSRVSLRLDALRQVEILKSLTSQTVIMSPRLRVAEYRGREIVMSIFEALAEDGGHRLLPTDYQSLYRRVASDPVARHRVICDFIAGMTDAFAIEFYSRLRSVSVQSIFKPF